jgi:hypothetical protein
LTLPDPPFLTGLTLRPNFLPADSAGPALLPDLTSSAFFSILFRNLEKHFWGSIYAYGVTT